MVAAGVPGRMEYWKVKALEKRDASTTSRVRSKSAGLPGEADDDVRGDRCLGDLCPDLVEDAEELLGAVGALIRRSTSSDPDCSGM